MELQFQINNLQTENKLLKITSEYQQKEIEKLQEEIADKNNLKNIVEETNDELVKLKNQLDQEDIKKESLKRRIVFFILILIFLIPIIFFFRAGPCTA